MYISMGVPYKTDIHHPAIILLLASPSRGKYEENLTILVSS